MKTLRLILLCLAASVTFGAPAQAQEDVRFSKTLGAMEFSSMGLGRLSSDQLAVLDALIRRDVANARRITRTPPPAKFSDRLTPDERRNAGLELLTPAQLTVLDQDVQRLIAPPEAPIGMASGSSATVVPSFKIRRGPAVHGSFELMVGAGSHGYSEYGGAATIVLDDPQSGMSIAVGYSELHSKGGYLYRGCRDGYLGGPGPWGWW